MQLQGIGEFYLENFYNNPFENEKGKNKVPDNAIRFEPDKKTMEDLGLIEFISANTKKIKPLAASDLEDFLNIGKQLLNVSKQFYIEGMGTLILNDQGRLEFMQGSEIFIPQAVDENSKQKVKIQKEEQSEDLNFEKYGSDQKGNTLKKVIVTVAFAAGLFIIGWIGWYFFKQWQDDKNASAKNIENIQPVLTPAVQKKDTASLVVKTPDSLSVPAPDPVINEGSFDVVIETASKTRALYRFGELQKMGYKVGLGTTDSVSFTIYTSINRPLTDSSKVLDSISRFFGRKARVIPK